MRGSLPIATKTPSSGRSLRDPSTVLSSTTPVTASSAAGAQSVFAADLDGDGDLDLVVTNVSGTLHVFDNNDGDTGFTELSGAANPFDGLTSLILAGLIAAIVLVAIFKSIVIYSRGVILTPLLIFQRDTVVNNTYSTSKHSMDNRLYNIVAGFNIVDTTDVFQGHSQTLTAGTVALSLRKQIGLSS